MRPWNDSSSIRRWLSKFSGKPLQRNSNLCRAIDTSLNAYTMRNADGKRSSMKIRAIWRGEGLANSKVCPDSILPNMTSMPRQKSCSPASIADVVATELMRVKDMFIAATPSTARIAPMMNNMLRIVRRVSSATCSFRANVKAEVAITIAQNMTTCRASRKRVPDLIVPNSIEVSE